MSTWSWFGWGGIASALIACGGKVVFVETDGGASSAGGSGGASGPDICTELCDAGIGCGQFVAADCPQWCAERVADAGSCAPEFEAMLRCAIESPPIDCMASPACQSKPEDYAACVYGDCIASAECGVTGSVATCNRSCSRELEWICTTGQAPLDCTCKVDGLEVASCTDSFGTGIASCCDAFFADAH